MAGKLEIQWSPISNKFITWGSEICLYEVQPARETSAHGKNICLYATMFTCVKVNNNNNNLTPRMMCLNEMSLENIYRI